MVGASYRIYRLNSQNTLFYEPAGPVSTKEYGSYIQISKKFIDDKLKLTASGRYDKNENFEGKFTPRLSAVFTVAPNQNIRASYQNAYRFPSNQNQWINLPLSADGSKFLIGGLPQLRTLHNFNTNPVINAVTGQAQTFGTYKPETVNSYELGYKGLFAKKFLVDIYGYYSNYKDFIGRISVVQSKSGNPATINPNDASTYIGYSVSVNSSNKVNTYGWGIGVNYLLPANFSIDANLSSDMIDNPDPNFATYWNTPKYRANAGISNSGFGYKNYLVLAYRVVGKMIFYRSRF